MNKLFKYLKIRQKVIKSIKVKKGELNKIKTELKDALEIIDQINNEEKKFALKRDMAWKAANISFGCQRSFNDRFREFTMMFYSNRQNY